MEGLAEYLSIGPVDSQTAMWLRDAVQSNKLPTLKQLGNPRFFPYRFGHAFWAYVGGRWGDDQAITLFREGVRTGDANGSIKKVLGAGREDVLERVERRRRARRMRASSRRRRTRPSTGRS